MKAVGWNNGKFHKSGAGFEIKINKKDRDMITTKRVFSKNSELENASCLKKEGIHWLVHQEGRWPKESEKLF